MIFFSRAPKSEIMFKIFQVPIVNKKSWENYHLLSLESPEIALQAQPGQFIMVRISSRHYPLLRRPLSIHAVNKKNIEIFFQNSGTGTSILSKKKVNDFLDIIGPLGKGFNLETSYKEKQVAVIGGGRGIAPLYFLTKELKHIGYSVNVFYGGKTHSDLPLKEKFEKNGFKIYFSTDDGSLGFKGFVTESFQNKLNKIKPALIFACGPEVMLEKISRIAKKEKIPAEFSLESIMGCGFGACWSCVKKIKTGKEAEWVKICEEGPVFSLDEISWSEE